MNGPARRRLGKSCSVNLALAKINKIIDTALERKRDMVQDGFLFSEARGQNYASYIPAIHSKRGKQTKVHRGCSLSLNDAFSLRSPFFDQITGPIPTAAEVGCLSKGQ